MCRSSRGSIADRLEKSQSSEQKSLLSQESLEKSTSGRLLNHFPIISLLHPDQFDTLTDDLMSIMESIKPSHLRCEETLSLLMDTQKKNDLVEWYQKLFFYVQRELLDENGHLQTRISDGFGGLGWGGKNIYQAKTIHGFVSSFIGSLIQDMLAIADNCCSSTIHLAVTHFITKKSDEELAKRLKVKSFNEASDYLDAIIVEFVSTPENLRTSKDYGILRELMGELFEIRHGFTKANKPVSIETLQHFLVDAIHRFDGTSVLKKILIKHFEIANAIGLKEPEEKKTLSSSSPHM